jgi:exoribonuclease R
MIPAKLSEGLLSLQEGELRPTITYSIPFDENLTPGELRIQQTKIVSRKKCTYEEIGDALRNGEHPLHKEVRDFANLAYDLKHVRLEKGAEDYRIEKALTPREEATTNAMSMVAEFMVVTNTKVTEFFSNNDIPTLFRNFRKDASPAEKRDLREKLEDLFADVDPADEKLIKHILKIAYGRAEYSTINRGHEALAVDFYGHHTSPLRRISDLLAQQQRNAAIRGETLPYSKSNLEIFGDNINAKKFERDLYAIEWRDEDKKAQQLNPLSKTKLIRSKDIFLHAVKKEP